MATLMRTWAGLTAVGAGLVHIGIAAGTAPALLPLLTAVGAAEMVWGAAALARRRIPVPRAALAVAVLAVAGWVAALLLEAGSMVNMSGGGPVVVAVPAAPMLGAAALDLAGAAVLALGMRRGPRDDPEPRVWSYLTGVIAGAAVVAGITALSLSATSVGALAKQGMEMGR